MKPRITISPTPAQMKWLKREARTLGISISELLRRLLDGWIGENG